MPLELILKPQVRGASDTARIRRILLVTTRYFGIEAFPCPRAAKGKRPSVTEPPEGSHHEPLT